MHLLMAWLEWREYLNIIYHDVVEIEEGDIPLSQDSKTLAKADRQEAESKALNRLKEKLPRLLKTKVPALFKEFQECKTPEARFANAIDKLDAVIQELDYKRDWKGWAAEFLKREKAIYFEPFPEIKETFEGLMRYLAGEGYFG